MVGSVKKAAFIGAGVEIPKVCINTSSICRALTVNYRRMGDPTPIPVAAYVDTGPTIVLPREYGLHLISNLDIEVIDRCSYGYLMDFPVEVTHTGKYAYQEDFVAEILENTKTRYDFMVHAATGKGKCLAKGTHVLMFDGRTLPVEKIRVGDLLMGPDSTPRTVKSLAHGEEEMFRVTPTKGDPYTVNRSHILSLRITGLGSKKVYDSFGVAHSSGDIVDISVDGYLASSDTFKHCAKGWRTGVEFSAPTNTPIPAYILGSWLGDGSSRGAKLFSDDTEVVQEWRRYADSIGLHLSVDTGPTVGTYRIASFHPNKRNPMMYHLREMGLLQNKHIPKEYLTSSRSVRLEVLAGLVDTDGCVSCGCFDLVFVNRRLADDTVYLARSLGMAAYAYPCRKRCTNTDVWGSYFRVRVSGDISEVPCRVPRKKAGLRQQKKNVLNVGIQVTSVGIGEYFGFEIDGDRRFLLGDFTVTHNTVCALSVIQKLGVTAIVLVDQENLLLQWVAECKKVLHLTDDQIGIVQGPVCSYENKHVTIAMVQTLKTREFAEEFYKNFGVVVFDEVHSVGAPTFSKTLLMFPAYIRFGVSATVDRKDSLQKLLQWNLGEVAVSLLDKHESSLVYFVRNHTVYSWYANISPKSGRILKEISEDGKRNNLLCRIVQWLYEEGDRDILVIGDRIEQLENLMAMCAYAGVPEDDMGLYCGFRNIWAFAKDPTPKRRPVGYERGTEYTPVTFGRVRKRIPRAELESIKNCKRIIFATYGMFSKGVDVPRLSAGVDCTPRSKTEQVHGRILRVLDGKYLPLWVTIRDVFSYKTEHQFHQRIQGYVASSAEIYEWELNKGVRSWDASALSREVAANIKELKAQNIETLDDGRYTLTAPSTRTRYARRL
jgi:superfamily II DNA or RNA helicase